jgi:hypothetical protein
MVTDPLAVTYIEMYGSCYPVNPERDGPALEIWGTATSPGWRYRWTW